MTELEDIDHTNPYTEKPFGETQTYGRGQFVAADGGVPGDEREDETERTNETLGDISHTPPRNAPSTNGVYDRTDR
ncbi:MAG: hypothetical protein U5K28_03105 [Halobacteriales archaeon]|nr:hypothetical protein [Halobacteriales archaeon]